MEYESDLSDGQYKTLVVVMGISAFLSVLGSIVVMRIAHLKLTSTYQRFLLMLSFSDLLNSLFLIFHQLVLPESPAFPWAFGTMKTCKMVGFFAHYGSLSAAMLSCYLGVYFHCSIQSSPKRLKQPEDIIGIWEWIAHLTALLIPAALASSMLATDSIAVSEKTGLCLARNYACEGTNDNGGSCVTGSDVSSDTILGWVHTSLICLASLVGIASTISVYCRVRSTITRGSQHNFDGSLNDEVKQRLRAVATQSILYTSVFVNTFFWPTIGTLLPLVAPDTHPFALQVIAFIFFPLQGALNCLIYIRPRYQMLRAMYPEDSFQVVLRVSMSKAGDPDEIEEVRERIYGDNYEMPSVDSSEHSLASDIPVEVSFDPNKPLSATSLVSAPKDDDDMDPEVNTQKESLEEDGKSS